MLPTHPTIDDAKMIAQRHFGIHATKYKTLVGELDKNFFIQSETGETYILKIANSKALLGELQLQNALMEHVAKHEMSLQLSQWVANLEGQAITILKDENDKERYIRLLKWVDGRLWAKVCPKTPALLYQLGASCAQLTQALQGFDHPYAHRKNFKWDNAQASWTKDVLHYFTSKKEQETAAYFVGLYEKLVLQQLPHLRQAVNHNDLNDLNILVSTDLKKPHILGFIDFGDALYTPIINELAIASAYAIMDKADPLSAAVDLVKGYHSIFPLEEKELDVLFPLITTRLLISVCNSAYNKIVDPNNVYLLVSENSAWKLLDQLSSISPDLARYAFRQACGYQIVPKGPKIQAFLEQNQAQFAPIIGIDLNDAPVKILDLSVGSLELGNNSIYEDNTRFHQQVLRLMQEAEVEIAIGRYCEPRPIYTTDNYLVKGNQGPEWRSIHIGLDIFAEAGTPVFAPLSGKIHSFQNNASDRNYGPTIIVEHQTDDGELFYTLYGHLSIDSLNDLEKGMAIEKGQPFASFGDVEENGGWSPHLHFQVILDMLGQEGDFAGVAFPTQSDLWCSLCPDPNLILNIQQLHFQQKPPKKEALNSSRKKHLGASLSLSYQEPLHIVRGYGQYLYDSDGRRYLDTVNNVPHVGHQHPFVVRAAQEQFAVLNTNTRYLHENIVRYAEELCASLPEELCVCHFVNSGSEANELAIRMARAYTGQKDMLVAEVGYHGNTNACIDVSSYKFEGKGGKGAPDWVHVMPIPDTYRGMYRKEDAHAAKKYAAHLQKAIERLAQKDKGVAGFLCEAILSCGGQIVPPKGYFQQAYQYVRAAGGLCIADEVQVGFGRVGTHFWAFEQHDVVPDIVTMGKPIGNGHPLGAVVTTKKVATAFANGMEYFNTFGGNPVSCAIGRAVLQVIESENLQQNALEVGGFLLEGLQDLKRSYPIIGDVRGSGLFLGFELIKDPNNLMPAPEQTSYLANRMREHGILTSTDGLHHNVIKIKPPMVFTKENAIFLLEMLADIFKEDFMRC